MSSQPTADIEVAAATQNNEALWDTLRNSHSQSRGIGWRARDLGVNRKTSREKFEEKFLSEYVGLKSYLAGLKACGMAPNEHKLKSKKDKKFRKRATQWEPLSLCYLSEVVWGVGKNFGQPELKKNETYSEKKALSEALEKNSKHPINNRQAAKDFYTAEHLFLAYYMQKKIESENHLEYEKRSRLNVAMTLAKRNWVQQTTINRRVWEANSREHDAQQPFIKDRMIKLLRGNPSKGFRQVACDINDWCSYVSIHRWMKSHDTYCQYVERILPLLSQQQKPL
jgi:hypothetical protein